MSDSIEYISLKLKNAQENSEDLNIVNYDFLLKYFLIKNDLKQFNDIVIQEYKNKNSLFNDINEKIPTDDHKMLISYKNEIDELKTDENDIYEEYCKNADLLLSKFKNNITTYHNSIDLLETKYTSEFLLKYKVYSNTLLDGLKILIENIITLHNNFLLLFTK
jgi:hypothetical protein